MTSPPRLMDSPSTPDFHGANARSLLAITPPSLTGPGGSDLSLSELTLSDLQTSKHPLAAHPKARPNNRGFSLFAVEAPPSPEDQSIHSEASAHTSSRTHSSVVSGESHPTDDEVLEAEIEAEYGVEESPTKPVSQDKGKVRRTREEQLMATLFSMRKLNASFNEYLGALQATQEHNHRLASKVDQTKQLLDKYVAILGQSEHTARLLLDPNWQGAEADELYIWQEAQRAAQEKAHLAREEKERIEREERERIEREEREEREREEKERERERKEKEGTLRGRGRGRGRGLAAKARAPSVSGIAAPRPSSVTNIKRPSSAASSSRPSGIGTISRGRGRGV